MIAPPIHVQGWDELHTRFEVATYTWWIVCGTSAYVLSNLHLAPCVARLHPRPGNYLSCLRALYLCVVSGYAELTL